MPTCSNHSSSSSTTHRVVKQEAKNPSSPKKRWVPSKFKQSPVKKGKLSKDQTVYTVGVMPGYAVGYVLEQNGDNGFFYPFQIFLMKRIYQFYILILLVLSAG